jgi:hypothetical protein
VESRPTARTTIINASYNQGYWLPAEQISCR